MNRPPVLFGWEGSFGVSSHGSAPLTSGLYFYNVMQSFYTLFDVKPVHKSNFSAEEVGKDKDYFCLFFIIVNNMLQDS